MMHYQTYRVEDSVLLIDDAQFLEKSVPKKSFFTPSISLTGKGNRSPLRYCLVTSTTWNLG